MNKFSIALAFLIFTLPEKVVKRYLKSKGIEDTFEGGWKQIQQEIRSDSSLTTGTKKKTAVLYFYTRRK